MKRACEIENENVNSFKKVKENDEGNIIFETGGDGLNFLNFNPNLDFDIGKPLEEVLKTGDGVLKTGGAVEEISKSVLNDFDIPFDKLKETANMLPILKKLLFGDVNADINLVDTSFISRSEMDVYDPLSSNIYINVDDNTDILTNLPVARVPFYLYVLHLMQNICLQSKFNDLSACNILMKDKSLNFALSTITILWSLMKKLVENLDESKKLDNFLDKFLTSIDRFKNDSKKGGEFLSKAFTFEKQIPISKFECISKILTHNFKFATKIVELKPVELIALGLLVRNSSQDFIDIYAFLNPNCDGLLDNSVNAVNNAAYNAVDNAAYNAVDNAVNNVVDNAAGNLLGNDIVSNGVITFTTHPPEHRITNSNFDIEMNLNFNNLSCSSSSGEKFIVIISLLNIKDVDISDGETNHLKAAKRHLDLKTRKFFLTPNQSSLKISKIKIQSNHQNSIVTTNSVKNALFIKAELFKCVNGREISCSVEKSNPFYVYSHKSCMDEENKIDTQSRPTRQPNRISFKPEISKLIPESGTLNSEINIIGNFTESKSIILEINGGINTKNPVKIYDNFITLMLSDSTLVGKVPIRYSIDSGNTWSNIKFFEIK